MAPDGPLAGSTPGDLTRWLSTPWHSDAASCRSGYEPEISTVLPTFWPARVPNHVLREADYLVVVDTAGADGRTAGGVRPPLRLGALRRRQRPRPATLHNMIEHWGELGIVTEKPGPPTGPSRPS